MGYAFVVPASSLARFAFHIYENTLGSDNQCVYRGIRVLDPPRGGSCKSKRTVRYVPAALDAYMATANPSPDLSSGRYVGYAPFPRRLSAGGPVFSSFPPIVGEPDARRGVPPPPGPPPGPPPLRGSPLRSARRRRAPALVPGPLPPPVAPPRTSSPTSPGPK